MQAALALVLLVTASSALSQDENDGKVAVSITGIDGELLENVKGFLPLYRFDGKAPPSAGRVRLLHSQGEEAIRKALAPFGYYRPEVNATLEQQEGLWRADYAIDARDAIPVTDVDIRITGEATSDPSFAEAIETSPLTVGAPLRHADYEALKQRFQVLASERGYFDARLTESAIRIDLKRYESTVRLYLDSGSRYYLGDVTFDQDKPWLNEDLLRRYVEIDPGQAYLAEDLQQLQGDLSNTEYYQEVTLDVSPENADDDLAIPVDVKLVARNPTRYTFGAGYGTDTGARVKAALTRRRLNESGHRLTGETLLSQFIIGAAGEYIIPGSDPRTDSYALRGSIVDEHTDATNFTSATLGGYYRHRDELWLKTYSLDYLVERYTVEPDEETSKLLIPGIDWTRTFPAAMDERIYPEFGTRLQLTLKGASDSLLSDTSFIQLKASGKWIHSFDNASRLIVRGAAGTTSVSDFDRLPTSLRFFAGGDKSVRGYGYNVIGPASGEVVAGGKRLLEASIEYELPVRDAWNLALFADAGDAFNETPNFKAGVGIGLHWRSPIGPVRLDLGHALDVPPGRSLRGHLTIGADL